MADIRCNINNIIFFYAILLFFLAKISSTPFNNSLRAILVFGDSIFDSGNNDYIKTLSKANFPPYGRDFPNHIPTGRFSNGRLITDFIASYAGIKESVPPYLDPTLTTEDLMTGVSFASASSGYDPLTAQISAVISMQRQLAYFREYKRRLQNSIGKEKTEILIANAAFFISAGSNDLAITYFGTPFRRKRYPTFSSYQQFLFQLIEQFVQGLEEEGARNMAFAGALPLGCLPAVITLGSSSGHQLHHRRGCIESLNTAGTEFNRMLQRKAMAMQNNTTKIVYLDLYTSLDDMIRNPIKYGFAFSDVGCCGTGLVEVSISCNPKSIACPDASTHVFWDSLHPTETTYSIIFEALRPTIDDVLKVTIG